MNFMPKIPHLNNPTIQPQPLGGGELRLNVTPELVGGAKVRNLDAFSGTLGEAAVFMDVQRQRRDTQSIMKLEKAATGMAAEVREGMTSLKGEKSFGFAHALQRVITSWNQPSDETPVDFADPDSELMETYQFDSSSENFQTLRKGLAEMPQYLREEYQPILEKKMSRLLDGMRDYEEVQWRRSIIQNHQNTARTSLESIRKNPSDPQVIEDEIEVINRSIEMLQVPMGLSDERVAAEKQKALERVNLTVIESLLKSEHPEEAMQYFRARKEEFHKTDITQLEAQITGKVELKAGEALGNEIYSLPKDLQGRALRDEENSNVRRIAQQHAAYRSQKEYVENKKVYFENEKYVEGLIENGETTLPWSAIENSEPFQKLSPEDQELYHAMWKRNSGVPEREDAFDELNETNEKGIGPSPDFTGQIVNASGGEQELAFFNESGKPETSFKIKHAAEDLKRPARPMHWKEAMEFGLVSEIEADKFYKLFQAFKSDDIKARIKFARGLYTKFGSDLSPETITFLQSMTEISLNALDPIAALGENHTLSPAEVAEKKIEFERQLQEERKRMAEIEQGVQNMGLDPKLGKVILFDAVKQYYQREGEMEKGQRLSLNEISKFVDDLQTMKNEKKWQDSVRTINPFSYKGMDSQQLFQGVAERLGHESLNDNFKQSAAQYMENTWNRFEFEFGTEMSLEDRVYLARSLLENKVSVDGSEEVVSSFFLGLPSNRYGQAHFFITRKPLKQEGEPKRYQVFVNEVFQMPRERKKAIGKQLREMDKPITLSHIMEQHLKMPRLNSDRFRPKTDGVIHKVFLNNLKEYSFTGKEEFNKILENLTETPTVVSKKGSKTVAPLAARLGEEQIDELWKVNPKAARRYKPGDIMIFKAGAEANATLIAETAYRLPLDLLRRDRDQLLSNYDERLRPELGKLFDGIIQDKEQEQGSLLFVQKESETPERDSQLPEEQPLPLFKPSEDGKRLRPPELTFKFDGKETSKRKHFQNVQQVVSEEMENLPMDAEGMTQFVTDFIQNHNRVKWKSRNGEPPRGMMSLNRSQAEFIAANGPFDYNAAEIQNHPDKNLRAGIWYLFGFLRNRFNDTDNPLGFAMMAQFIGEEVFEEIRNKISKNDNEGKNIFSKVAKEIPREIRTFIKKAASIKKEKD